MKDNKKLSTSELLVKIAKENEALKILEIAKNAKDKEEIIEEIKKLIDNDKI